MTDKVLLVDDEPNILKGFQRHLRKDFNLHVAVGGAAALEAVRDEGAICCRCQRYANA